MASTALRISVALQCTSSSKEPIFAGNPRSTSTISFLPRRAPLRSAGLCFSRRRPGNAAPTVTTKKINKKKSTHKNVGEDEGIDEDAFEALFSQLEEDLKNDESLGNDGEDDDDDDISEEELVKLEQELEEAFEDDELLGESENEDEEVDDEGDDEDEDEDEDEEKPIKLKTWQLKRLAYALKNGRRNTRIKNLAADVCLDRAVVLKLLRDPPPNLVMMSATLPDKPVSLVLDPVEKPTETVPLETTTPSVKQEAEVKVPIHAMQRNWSARKRLKRVQLETLEQVYRRTKRPTNAMISSIVHVTSLPWKRVVKWFEDKRAEDGVPEKRFPYRPSESESVFTT